MNGTVAVMRYTLIELTRRRILLVFFIIGVLGIGALGVGVKLFYSAIIQGTTQGGGPNGGSCRVNYAPVFVSPAMQWAVPNGCAGGGMPAMPAGN